MQKVIVIGAGVTGLVCAKELLEKGVNVEIYDDNNSPGGLLRSIQYGKYHIDLGPHIYHTQDSQVLEYWEKNLPGCFKTGQFRCKNVKGDKYYDYPVSLEGISKFSPALKNKILDELKNVDPKDAKVARNYRDYIRGFVGPTLQEMFFEEYPAKIWGIPTTILSANWAPKRIELRKDITPFYHNQWCGVGRFGCSTVPDELLEKIKKSDGKVHFKHKVNFIHIEKNKIKSISFSNGKKITIDKDTKVISTMSITKLSGILGINTTLKFRSLALVYLVVKRPFVLPKGISWLYYDSDKIIFHRVSEQKKFSDENQPKNETILSFEIAANKEDKPYKLSSKELIALTKRDAVASNLFKEDEVVDAFVEKIDEVLPVFTLGYEAELSRVKSLLNRVGNMYTVGGPAEFIYADIQILFCKALDLVDLITNKDYKLARNTKIYHDLDFKKSVNIGKDAIGEGSPVYIIAEAGLNHNGDMEMAKKLIMQAKKCGCNAIKFQTYKPESRVSAKAKAAKYIEKTIGLEESSFDMFKKLMLSEAQHRELFKYARQLGIEIFSTPFDEESADFLEQLHVNVFKIASFDLVNIRFLKHVASKGKPMIVSTGMATLGQIEEALEAIYETGNRDLVLMHCVSNYPMYPEDANLKAILTIASAFKVPVGFSDHSIGDLMPVVAVSIGARVIEKHFTLDKCLEGPDHILSLDPGEMEKMVRDIRTIEKALGSGIKTIRPSEYETINLFRKSIFAKVDIKKGTVITENMLCVKGPGHGLLPRYLDIVIGRVAKDDISADYPLTWDHV